MSLVAAAAMALPAGLTARAQSIGETHALMAMAEGTKTVPVATDQKALDAFYKAIAAHDQEGMMELFDGGRIIAPDVGTKVRVLDGHGLVALVLEVRILEGAYKGRRGFVSATYVSDK